MFWGRFPLRSGWMDGWVGGWKMEDGRGGNLKRGEEEDEEEVREGSEADGEMVGIYLYLSGSMVEWMGMLAWYLSTLTLRSPSDSAFKQTTAKLSSEFELKRHGSTWKDSERLLSSILAVSSDKSFMHGINSMSKPVTERETSTMRTKNTSCCDDHINKGDTRDETGRRKNGPKDEC
ncbi:hypothetical protein NEUTE2DRAFT_128345 [Neurospora tetrasperma FGSC 2509]|nr:hypothetical protein NEUTE2DRAFT_128345 [Neurospora tetrasperma FGSC 2509]